MNFNYNEEQEKIFKEALKAALELKDKIDKLNPKYRSKLLSTLIEYSTLKNFIDSKGNSND